MGDRNKETVVNNNISIVTMTNNVLGDTIKGVTETRKGCQQQCIVTMTNKALGDTNNQRGDTNKGCQQQQKHCHDHQQ